MRMISLFLCLSFGLTQAHSQVIVTNHGFGRTALVVGGNGVYQNNANLANAFIVNTQPFVTGFNPGISFAAPNVNFGSGIYGNSNVALIPQSFGFFAASNPVATQFRVQSFNQFPGTTAIVRSNGTAVQFLNGGILGFPRVSRGTQLFIR